MVKNKEILEIIERKKNEVSCENCEYCNLGVYHSGKWYCDNPDVSIFETSKIEECFKRRGKEKSE